jgi:uncharacterized protein
MAGIGKALKDGIRAAMEGPDGHAYEAAGKRVHCGHCGGEAFLAHEALMNTTGATMGGVDWTDRSGTALVCVRCSLIQWFARSPERR